MTITRLIKYIMARVEDIVEGITSVDHKAIIEVLKMISKRSAIFIRS